jgi:hypothetical protein
MKYFTLLIILFFVGLLNCFAQSTGYYYDTTGKKVMGIIDFPGNGLIIYICKKGAKKIWLAPDNNINSFVVGEDSFAIRKDLNSISSRPVYVFAHILEDGKIKIYDFSLLFNNSGSKLSKDENAYYFIEKDEKVYKINKIGWMYNFRKIMNEILSDYPDLEKEYIKKNMLTVANLKYIIEKYNNHFKTNHTSLNS